MSHVNEQAVALEWLYTTLHGDSTLMGLVSTVYRGLAPDLAATPYLLLVPVSGRDTYVPGSTKRYLSAVTQQVVVVGEATKYATISSAAARLDALLEAATGSNSDGVILRCRRQQPLALDEVVNGALWSRLGGLYSITVQAT